MSINTLQKYEPPVITPARSGRTVVGGTDGVAGFNPTYIGGFYPTDAYVAVRMFTNADGFREARPATYLNYRLNYELLIQSPPMSDAEITQAIENNLRGQFDASLPYVYLFADYNAWIAGPGPAATTPQPEIFEQRLPFEWSSGGVTKDCFPDRGIFTFSVDVGMYGVVGLAGADADLADPSAIPFGFLFRSGLPVRVIERGVEFTPGVETFINPSTQFAVRYVDGLVTYFAGSTVLRTVSVVPDSVPRVLHGAACLYGANSRVTGISVNGFSAVAGQLPRLVAARRFVSGTLPALRSSAGWLPYAAASLPAMRGVGGMAPYAYVSGRLPAMRGAGGVSGYAAVSLRPLTMTGGRRSAAAIQLPRLMLRASKGPHADVQASLPGLSGRGYAGRVNPKGMMGTMPRIRGVGTGVNSNNGSVAGRLPKLIGRSARFGSAAMSLKPLRGFGFADPAGAAYLSGAPIMRAPVEGQSFVIVQIDSAGSIVSVASLVTVLDDLVHGAISGSDVLTAATVLEALVNSSLVGASFQPLSEQGAETWVINADSGASTSYENYAFNSFATIDGRLYGVRSDGLYLLEGDTDAGLPIRASLSFGASDFSTEQLKRLEYALIGVASSGTMYLKVKIRGGDVYTYAARRSDDFMAIQRIDVGRGIRASYLGFELYNSDGCDFELNTVSFHAAELTRRI